eukprot:3475202-Rhodomonas_salina.5
MNVLVVMKNLCGVVLLVAQVFAILLTKSTTSMPRSFVVSDSSDRSRKKFNVVGNDNAGGNAGELGKALPMSLFAMTFGLIVGAAVVSSGYDFSSLTRGGHSAANDRESV